MKLKLKSLFVLLLLSSGLILLTTNCGTDDEALSSLTENYTVDDIFSYDYVHPSEKGQVYLTNIIIDGLNTKYSANISKRKYTGTTSACYK